MPNSSIPVLRVSDYPRARKFWTETMGFKVGEEGGDPARFGIFHRGKATIFVDAWYGADAEASPGWRAYFHVDDVDTFADSINWPAKEGPENKVYGMREVVITDPEGNRLCFGMDAE
ncbi:MAG: hypothetical protein HKP37_12365 [Boseongicola sp.]|nr:VOC family protein [Boseongicola sp.]NNL19525.1 hypothetical protein [Boseongicola sp.]